MAETAGLKNSNSLSRDGSSGWTAEKRMNTNGQAAWHGSCFTVYPTMAAADLTADDGTKEPICKEADA